MFELQRSRPVMEKEQNVRVKPNTSCCCLWLPASRHVDTPAPESRSLWACGGKGGVQQWQRKEEQMPEKEQIEGRGRLEEGWVLEKGWELRKSEGSRRVI